MRSVLGLPNLHSETPSKGEVPVLDVQPREAEPQVYPLTLTLVTLMSLWLSSYLNNIVLACEVKPDSTKVEGDRGKLWDPGTLDEVLQKKNGEGGQVVPALLKCLG